MSQRGTSIAQLASFATIGTAGFGVDTAVLYGAMHFGFGLYVGRAISYLVAVTFTWALNRRFTFESRAYASPFGQWGRFALSQLSGAIINLGVYSSLIYWSPFCAAHPVVGVGIGSLLGMSTNFIAATRYVFQ